MQLFIVVFKAESKGYFHWVMELEIEILHGIIYFIFENPDYFDGT